MAKFWALRKIILYNMVLNKKNCSRLKTSPFDSIWLEIPTNWHTTSQGPKKKSIKITKGRIDPCPAHTARNKGSFTTMVLWIAQRFLSSTVYLVKQVSFRNYLFYWLSFIWHFQWFSSLENPSNLYYFYIGILFVQSKYLRMYWTQRESFI